MSKELEKFTNRLMTNDELVASDAPYFALKELGEMGERVIDYYYKLWDDMDYLVCEDEEQNRELSMAYTNMIYFMENDYRWDNVTKNISKLKEDGLFLLAIVANVFTEVSNFNSERFISSLSTIEADYDEFEKAYEDVEEYVDVEAEFVQSIADLIIEDFNRVEDYFENSHDEVEYNYYNEDGE